MKILIFSLNDAQFAIPVSDLVEINRIATLRKVEKGPDWVLGMINFHGKTTAVLNLKCLLSVKPSEPGPTARWLAVRYDEAIVCLTVDKVRHFTDLDRHIIDEMPSLGDGPELKYIRCFARIESLLVPVLDCKRVLREKALSIEELKNGGPDRIEE